MIEHPYSSSELMIVNAARLLKNGDVVFVGVGQPNLACNLAKRTHAPDLVMIYEAGVIGAEPRRLPLSIGDPTLADAICDRLLHNAIRIELKGESIRRNGKR